MRDDDDEQLVTKLRAALDGSAVVLDVPRGLRARWAVEHAIDVVGCWLVEHRCWLVAVALWRACGLW